MTRVPSDLGPVARLANVPFIAVIWAYRVTLSPLVGRHCRFAPTCSRYALEAYRLHGPIRGTRLTVARLLRCHPWCPGGYDPVPIPGVEPADRGANPPETDANPR